MKTLYALLISLLLVFSSLPSTASPGGPTAQLKPTIDRLLQILEDSGLQGEQHSAERRMELMAAIGQRFDFREMSRRILGRTWQTLPNTQQDRFVQQMTKLLENVYINKLENYASSKVRYVAERIKGSHAQVTTIITYAGGSLPVHYIMYRDRDSWMTYDINIEGVSLIRNYKEQFRSIIQEQTFDGLLKIIEQKNQMFARQDKAA